MVKKKIRDTIHKNNLINRGEHIVIGLSGGPDSVCLFSVLKELADEMDFALYAVHVNHGFRPGAAEEDQAYVEALCQQHGVSCIPFKYDCNAIAREHGLTSEEAGRKVRYESFIRVAQALIKNGVPQDSVKIAVAQNADDQAETVLLRLLRGTGPDGLAGMAYSRMEQNICEIRPLLDTWRSEIETYCEEKQLLPRIDHTNLQPIYTRNKIRLQLIPYLQENFNPNIMEALGRLSRSAGEDKAYLWQQAEAAYAELKIRDGLLQQDGLKQLPQPLKYRVIMKAFSQIGLDQDITTAHLEVADRILEAAGESREAEFPGGYKMIVRYGEAAFVRPEGTDTTAWDLKVRIENCYQNAGFSGELLPNAAKSAKGNTDGSESPAQDTNSSEPPVQEVAVFDYEKFTAAQCDETRIELRTRREGDFLPLTNGRKKLQNYFTDEKVPKEARDKVRFAAIGSEILWIPAQPELGIKKSRYNPKYKLDSATKNRLILELICEI